MRTPPDPTADHSRFGFSAPWYSLGIVTPERLGALEAEWARGEDRHPEHYRWRAFREFLTERRPLAPEVALALYQLGDAEPDQAMGGSMMRDIVRLPECPASVLDAARHSGRPFLVQAADRAASDA